MIATLATMVALPEMTPPVPLVDLFSLDKPIQSSHGKMPRIDDDDLDDICFPMGLIDKKELEPERGETSSSRV